MNISEARERLKNWQAKMSAYNHAMSLIYYDGSTTAPKGTAENRGRTLSILSEESYKLSTNPEIIEMLEFLDANKEELDETEKRIVFLALKDIGDTLAGVAVAVGVGCLAHLVILALVGEQGLECVVYNLLIGAH